MMAILTKALDDGIVNALIHKSATQLDRAGISESDDAARQKSLPMRLTPLRRL